jgi:D-sedoheptulose 7-phosphate isomerase
LENISVQAKGEILHNKIVTALIESAEVKMLMSEKCADDLLKAAKLMVLALKDGAGKIMFCGNGGSAADSQHLATEFTVRLTSKRERKALPAIALTTDTSTLTAAGNDYGFDMIFARQVEALGRPGDVLVCISTSGASMNVVKAAEFARDRGMKLIGFLGPKPGALGTLMDVSINIPSENTCRIQEGHITAGHILVGLVEDLLFGEVKD